MNLSGKKLSCKLHKVTKDIVAVSICIVQYMQYNSSMFTYTHHGHYYHDNTVFLRQNGCTTFTFNRKKDRKVTSFNSYSVF